MSTIEWTACRASAGHVTQQAQSRGRTVSHGQIHHGHEKPSHARFERAAVPAQDQPGHGGPIPDCVLRHLSPITG